ncbi:membrane protein insertion efficiency factor YidD [Candidatus Peregrinibacteria bacterium]|nr:membrane protein insertion efficiency factor YidD [Candidatus Peregrinibacteria bacterium]
MVLNTILSIISRIPSRIVIFLIRIYQKTLSPDHGFLLKKLFPNGYCQFRPSCSEYACLALKKDGLIKGGAKSVWRVLRCNPWSHGGLDLP